MKAGRPKQYNTGDARKCEKSKGVDGEVCGNVFSARRGVSACLQCLAEAKRLSRKVKRDELLMGMPVGIPASEIEQLKFQLAAANTQISILLATRGETEKRRRLGGTVFQFFQMYTDPILTPCKCRTMSECF